MRVAVIARLSSVGSRLLGLDERLRGPLVSSALGDPLRLRGLLDDPVDRWTANLGLILARLDASDPSVPPVPRPPDGRGTSRPFAAEWPAPSRAVVEPVRAKPSGSATWSGPGLSAPGTGLRRAGAGATPMAHGPGAVPQAAPLHAFAAGGPARAAAVPGAQDSRSSSRWPGLAVGGAGGPVVDAPRTSCALPSVQASPRKAPLFIQSPPRRAPLRVLPPGGPETTDMALPLLDEGPLPRGAMRATPEQGAQDAAPAANGERAEGVEPSGGLRLAPGPGRLADLLRTNLARSREPVVSAVSPPPGDALHEDLVRANPSRAFESVAPAVSSPSGDTPRADLLRTILARSREPVAPAVSPMPADAPIALEPDFNAGEPGTGDPLGSPRREGLGAGANETGARQQTAGVGLLDAERLADALADLLELELLRVYGTTGR